jgi:hypothetical protein
MRRRGETVLPSAPTSVRPPQIALDHNYGNAIRYRASGGFACHESNTLSIADNEIFRAEFH